MKNLVISAAIPAMLLAGVSAHAGDTPLQTSSFGTLGSTTNVSVGGTSVSRTLNFKLFGQEIIDQGLEKPGYTLVLNSIHYTFDVQLDSDGLLTNVTTDPGAFAQGTLNVLLSNPWQTVYKDPSFGNATQTWATAGTDLVLADSGGFNIAPQGGVWDPTQQTNNPSAVTLCWGEAGCSDPTPLGLTSGDWFNTGTFGIVTSLRAITTLAGELESGTGTYEVTFSTGTWGEVSVYYDYTYTPNEVPVPAPLALIAVGLGLLGLRRRLRKQ